MFSPSAVCRLTKLDMRATHWLALQLHIARVVQLHGYCTSARAQCDYGGEGAGAHLYSCAYIAYAYAHGKATYSLMLSRHHRSAPALSFACSSGMLLRHTHLGKALSCPCNRIALCALRFACIFIHDRCLYVFSLYAPCEPLRAP